MTALVLAPTAALGDFVGGLASRRTHVLHVVVLSCPVCVVVVGLVAPWRVESRAPPR